MLTCHTILPAVLISQLALACSNGAGPSGSEGEKADDLTSTIECSASKRPVFEEFFSGSVTSETLAGSVIFERKVSIDDIDDLTDLEARQIFISAVHLGELDTRADFDVAFEIPDEEAFEIRAMKLEDLSGESDFSFTGTWIRFSMGDTEVGLIFEAGTANAIAEVSDGDIHGCGDPAPVQETSCDEKLLNGFSADSALHQVHIDDFESEFTTLDAAVAQEAVALVREQLGCTELLVIDPGTRCTEVGEDAPWSTTCYVSTELGYYLVSADFVETVNVLFNRWD
jgi:hypothetical protein